jgi:hypothetical protein
MERCRGSDTDTWKRSRGKHHLSSLRCEYEEHFADQMNLYSDNLRNKDNILRCKDEMISNLEKELERVKRLIQ